MRRFIAMLPLGVAVLAIIVGFFVAAPNAPAASAYPTALQNFNTPTASSDGCILGQFCHSNACWIGTDPYIGCVPGTPRCHGCGV
jgi:hypothetical protein